MLAMMALNGLITLLIRHNTIDDLRAVSLALFIGFVISKVAP